MKHNFLDKLMIYVFLPLVGFAVFSIFAYCVSVVVIAVIERFF